MLGDKRAASPVNVDPEVCFEVETRGEAVLEVPCNLLKSDGDSIFCCGLIAPALVAAGCVSSAPSLRPLRRLCPCEVCLSRGGSDWPGEAAGLRTSSTSIASVTGRSVAAPRTDSPCSAFNMDGEAAVPCSISSLRLVATEPITVPCPLMRSSLLFAGGVTSVNASSRLCMKVSKME